MENGFWNWTGMNTVCCSIPERTEKPDDQRAGAHGCGRCNPAEAYRRTDRQSTERLVAQ